RPDAVELAARLPSHVHNDTGELHELGREGEEQAIRVEERRQADLITIKHSDAAAPSDDMDRPADPGAASSSDPVGSSEARHRGYDLQPRVR
ncbi:MAG: hypothetical protein ACKPKO_57370, partial [Candidatus Fonsibacter sp.]